MCQYGPYIALPPGRYRVEYFVRGVGAFDVVINNGTSILASTPRRIFSSTSRVVMEFDIGAGCPAVEFRTFAGDPTRHGDYLDIDSTVLTLL